MYSETLGTVYLSKSKVPEDKGDKGDKGSGALLRRIWRLAVEQDV